MAIAASTVTPSLTSSQAAAREFWRQAGADGMPPFYVMSQYYAQLSANSDDLPTVATALEQLLTGLGYETDVDTLFSELAAGQGEELGYWAGRYCLFDSDGNRFDLVVGRNGATLTVPPALVDPTKLPAGTDLASVTVLSGASFSDGVLQLANAQFQVSLRFTLPVSDATLDAGAAAFQATAPTCQGTFGPTRVDAAGSRAVNGKRGAWTQAGVNQTADGDPAAAWYGQYVLLDVTDVMAVVQAGGADPGTASVVQVPDPVYIYDDPSFGLTFQWGASYGGNVTYDNNVLQCADDDDDTTQYAMQFTAPQAGAAEINLAVTTAGVVRSYKGYWVGRYPPPSPVPQARLAKRPITAVYSAGSGASAGGYSQAIDVGSLSTDKPNSIVLPYGAVRNTYALTLNLTDSKGVATDTFSWAVTDNPNGRAAITITGDQTAQFSLNNLSDSDVGQQLQVTVQLTNNLAKPAVTYTLLFDITVIQCDAITIEPTVLPPVVVGTPYTQSLTAYGARSKFTWSDPTNDPNTSMPPGLTWDASSHQLSGTVTDAAQVGKALSLPLELAASDVIMNPLTTSLPITVQSGAAVASGVPSWAKILIYASPAIIVLTGIAAFALRDFLKGKANAKTVDAIETGCKIIENATGRNPREAGQSVLRVQKGALRTVERDMPYRLSLIEELREACTTLNHKIDGAEAMYARLVQYRGEHLIFEPDDPVDATYNDLIKDGYKTEAEINQGIVDHSTLVHGYRVQIEDIVTWGNNIRSRNESDQNEIDNASSSERNDARLLGDE